MILGGNNKTVVWSAACPISDLFGKGDRCWAQLTLCPISALPCQINQISDSSQPNNCIISSSSTKVKFSPSADLTICLKGQAFSHSKEKY